MSDDRLSIHAGRAALPALVSLCGLLFAATSVLAHGGHEHASGGGGESSILPVVLVGGGVLVLGTSVYLDHADMLDGRFADAGVFVGAVGLLAGFALALI